MNLHDLFHGSRLPDLPAELRSHVLGQAAAKQAAAKIDYRISLWERIFENRIVRFAWALCVVSLLITVFFDDPKLPESRRIPEAKKMPYEEVEHRFHFYRATKTSGWELRKETEKFIREIS